MATNGWYISKLITDLQEGKVDEFVKKEGKWFNYIKGEETTFTNAADNVGAATGNLDSAEITVQGIGSLLADATVSSGTAPQLGGNVVVNFAGGSNWSTTGFTSYNITALPATGTFTITPAAGYGVSAVDFTALTATFASWITDITFADTGNPGTASNTVVGTITFDTTQTVTSGATLQDTVTLSVISVPSLVAWSATLEINGVFYLQDGTAQDQASGFNAFDSVSINSLSNTQVVYQVSQYINPNSATTILSFVYTPGPDLVSTAPPDVIFQVQAGELTQYTTQITPSGNSYIVTIEYTPNTTASVDSQNYITINLNSVLGMCYFDTTQSPYALPDNGGTIQVPIANNLGPFTVTSSGDISSNITSITTVNNSPNSTSYAIVELDPNSSGSNVTGTLSVTSNGNTSGTPNDTINVEQGLEDVVTMGAAIEALYTDPWGSEYMAFTTTHPPSGSNSGWYSGLTGTGSQPIIPSEQTDIRIRAEFEEPAASIPTPNFVVTYSDPSNTGWLTSSGGQNSNSYVQQNFTVAQNPIGGAQRSATITHAHYNDPSNTESITITQEGGYDPSVNTLSFKSLSYSSPYTIPDGTEIEIDHNAQGVNVYIGVPHADAASDNPFSSTGQLPTISTDLPSIYWENTNNFLDNSATLNQNPPPPNILSVGNHGDPWWFGLTVVEDTPIIGSGASMTFAAAITHKVSFTVNENFNVDSSDLDFPIDRTFQLRGFNPENPTVTPDDIITVRQLGRPAANILNNSSGQVIVDSSYSQSNGIDLTAKANGSTPVAHCYSVGTGQSAIYPAVAPWLTGITTTTTGNYSEYNIHLGLEENWTSSNRSFTLGWYHSSLSNPATTNPLTQGSAADSILVTQAPANPSLSVSLANLPSGSSSVGGAIASTYNNNSYPAYQITASGVSISHSFSLPLSFNGSTPVIDDVEYFNPNPLSSTPAWVDGDPMIDGNNNIVFNINQQNTTGTPRVTTFKVRHGNVSAAYIEITIINI